MDQQVTLSMLNLRAGSAISAAAGLNVAFVPAERECPLWMSRGQDHQLLGAEASKARSTLADSRRILGNSLDFG
jgi:hypothetical protein